MNDTTPTPRTDTAFSDFFGCEFADYTPNQKRALEFARTLERELIAARALAKQLAEALELFRPVREQILSTTKTTKAFDEALAAYRGVEPLAG